jgi:hypothetical protein
VLRCSAKIIKAPKDKSSWSYIILGKRQVAKLNPSSGKSFRVKGRLDDFPIKFKSLLPLGDGRFLLPINAEMRKGTGKQAGDTLRVSFTLDKSTKRLSHELLECLRDEPTALAFFNTLNRSGQHYFSDWIASARTQDTKAERITLAVTALANRQTFTQMRVLNKVV